MKKINLVLALTAMIFLSSCEKITGEGPVVTETRNISNFEGIDLRVSADVYFQQSATYKVEVSAQQNILDVLETYVTGNKLVVKYKNNIRVKSHEPVMVLVSAPSSNLFRVSGSGNISATGILNPVNLDLDISGSGNINLVEVNTGTIDASISGSGDIKINAGTANHEKLKISGSGNFDLGNVLVQTANTHTSGSGDIRLHASQNLDVKISGSGSVYYKGNPIINSSISGSGKLVHF
jgi:hypothetical protein